MKPPPDDAALLTLLTLLTPVTRDFYVGAMEALERAGAEFLVGGAFALNHYTSIVRVTKDFDLFVRRADAERVLEIMAQHGFRAELTFPHWLGKIFSEDDVIDVIFSSGNGIAEVDDEWFAHAEEGRVLGRAVKIVPPEEMIWSKGYVMERERFDGADVNHLLLARSRSLDWERMLRRFGPHWRVLLAHLVLFGFVYPQERHQIPSRIVSELVRRAEQDRVSPPVRDRVCQGTLISSRQYQGDVDDGLVDGRLNPYGHMTQADIDQWVGMLEKGG